jgi:hypothetical protein
LGFRANVGREDNCDRRGSEYSFKQILHFLLLVRSVFVCRGGYEKMLAAA